ncbi:MAG: hypothetical protein GX425_09850 [Peptococcaceae bacterium]|nr:hypothetical protein [Peptococcaceae bacterium]
MEITIYSQIPGSIDITDFLTGKRIKVNLHNTYAWRFKKSEIEAWWAGAEPEPVKPAPTVKEILDKKLRPGKEDK